MSLSWNEGVFHLSLLENTFKNGCYFVIFNKSIPGKRELEPVKYIGEIFDLFIDLLLLSFL